MCKQDCLSQSFGKKNVTVWWKYMTVPPANFHQQWNQELKLLHAGLKKLSWHFEALLNLTTSWLQFPGLYCWLNSTDLRCFFKCGVLYHELLVSVWNLVHQINLVMKFPNCFGRFDYETDSILQFLMLCLDPILKLCSLMFVHCFRLHCLLDKLQSITNGKCIVQSSW